MSDDHTMRTSDSAAAQIALNETTFREVNEGIEEGRREREGLVPFVCECGELGCNAVVRVTLREYEGVRAGSRCFLVAPRVTGREFDELQQRGGAIRRGRQARRPARRARRPHRSAPGVGMTAGHPRDGAVPADRPATSRRRTSA